MKLNKNNKQGRIIGTDDIFVSSNNSSIGNDLGSILLKQDQDILDLKKNVKWLYKYGGVGGSGGGTAASNTKINCVLTYTDFNGIKVQSKINDNDVFNIKTGTPITVTCTIVSNKSLNEYTFTLNNLKTTIKATDINGSITTSPEGNQVYTITVIGETTVSLSFQIFTQVMELIHRIETEGGIIVLNNSSIYESQIQKANYVCVLKNYQPDSFESTINQILINQNQILDSQYTIETKTDKTTNIKTTTLTVPLKDLFTIYDIYNIQVNYTFGTEESSISDTFIYQSADKPFVYCWSDIVSVYKEEVSNPNVSNNYNNLIKYRIYPKQGDSITLKYNLTIEVEGEESNIVAQSNTQYSYTIVNKVNTEEYKQIPINFILDRNSLKYYIYLLKSEDVEYFFKNENGDKYYGTISCDTENPNPDIINFPSKDPTIEGNPIKISSDFTSILNKVQTDRNTIDSEVGNNVNAYILSGLVNGGTLYLDGLFSFGLKYGGSNWNLKILSIENGSNTLILYKNKIEYAGKEYEICIPNDDNYHLIQLYFKSSYKINGTLWDLDFTSGSQVVALYIDGILETKPIDINGFYIENGTKIIYHPGQWLFNHIGVATFNGKSMNKIIVEGFEIDNISKYLFDFDPIIPSNYYQTYRTRILLQTLSELFDKTIYSNLSKHSATQYSDYLWINYFTYKENGEVKHLNKFINIAPSVLAQLAPSNMEIYCIVPESTHLDQTESGLNKSPDYINQFLYNTITSYGEDEKVASVSCNFQKWKSDKFVDVISNENIQFYVKYQGSSTLLYKCKNFEIGIKPVLDLEDELPVYFTPDVDLFPYMEQCFNLKADVVDSSHSNNVVIGNFVNDYMVSPFNTTSKTYRSCLTGKPILLFILNNAVDPSDNQTILDDSYIFLGIYSLNLNRSSVHNLGYSYLQDSSGKEILTTSNEVTDEYCCDSITKFHILLTTEKEILNGYFAVAEVQDNGTLFDYSQFDDTLLANQILGDFFVNDNGRISREYSKAFSKPFKTLASIIYNYITKNNIFNKVDLSTAFKDEAITPEDNWYYTKDGVITKVESNSLVIESDTLNDLTKNIPYHTKDDNNIAYINDPLQQFHLICDVSGNPIRKDQNTKYYYIEKLDNLLYNYEEPDCKIDMESSVKYFVTCMAFAMVDSVLKNLTFKCPDTTNNKIWFPAFYDMDTAFGISNSGGSTSFQAFSDYVENGTIIQDYAPINANGFFDTPSSFLFMYAKYLDILTNMSRTDNGIYPFSEWSKLRSTGGIFESGTAFCKKYIDEYFGTINPLIWNLNYSYKYFSDSNTGDDTESSRFNGTRRFARKEYLNKRFRYLDVLFGFKNQKYIGRSNYDITKGSTAIPSNSDIKIKGTMFPNYTKGSLGQISVEVTEEPNTPIVLLLSTNNRKLYITDSSGNARVSGSVLSNTDVGFFGTLELTKVSECGLFLVNNSNTIENNKIEDINIAFNVEKDVNPNINIDLTKVTSVKNIAIHPSINTTQYGNIVISNTDNTLSFNLNKIEINNLKCSQITLNGFSVKELVLQNVSATTLTIDNLNVTNTFTIKSIGIETYNFSNLSGVNNITINDNSCKLLNVSNITANLFKFNGSRVTTLNLNSCTFGEFNLARSLLLLSVTVTNTKCKTFKLASNYTSVRPTISDTPITTLNLGFVKNENFQELHLSIPSLNKLTTLTLGEVTECYLENNAFDYCSSLQKLPTTSSNGETINYHINGEYVFRRADSLSKDSMLKCTLEKDVDGTFAYNMNIDLDFVINWFKTHAAYGLNYLFCGCKNIRLLYELSLTSMSGSLPSKYSSFESAFINSIKQRTQSTKKISGTFYFANVNILTKNVTDALVEKGITEIDSILGYTTDEKTTGSHFQFIERLALNNFEKIKLNGLQIHPEVEWLYPSCVAIDEDKHYIRNSSMSDYFDNNCKVVELINFTPQTFYNDGTYKTVTFDFGENGFPKSMKKISMFKITNDVNVKNMENAFNQVEDCELMYDSFHNTLCTHHDNDTDLFKMFFKETEEGIVPKVSFSFAANASDGFYYSFPKKLQYEDFKKIMKYFIDNLYTTLSFFFRGTKIYNCDNDHILDYSLYLFKDLIHTFAYCNFYDSDNTELSIDISNAFRENEYSTENVEKNSLRSAFEGCYLKKFKERLPISQVSDMTETFKNCSFSYDTPTSGNVSIWSDSKLYQVPVYINDDFKLLPDKFFNIGGSNCNFKGCFSCDGFEVNHLTGFLPDENTMNLSGLNCDNIFTNCNITYYTLNDLYRMFPKWYTNLQMSNKYNVYMPFPPSTQKIVYLFEDTNDTGEYLNGDYGSMPSFPDRLRVGVTTNYCEIIAGNEQYPNAGQVKVSKNMDLFPSKDIKIFKNMIPYRLSMFMIFNSTPTIVIQNLNTISGATGPVIYDKDGDSIIKEDYIFKRTESGDSAIASSVKSIIYP